MDPLGSLNGQITKDYFSAVCFTETPLNEIYSLLEISRRRVNLKPYGLVFLKEKLQECVKFFQEKYAAERNELHDQKESSDFIETKSVEKN